MKRSLWSSGLSVTGGGTGVVAHAGSVGLRLVGDRTGLTGQLSKALVRRSFTPVHDRGRVLVDVAVMIADGGEAIADIEVLRHQGPVRVLRHAQVDVILNLVGGSGMRPG